jgi:metal-responsive CopG/Arc/MetJ family transcriptional regulator
MKRGSITKAESRMLTIWVPEQLIPKIDAGVRVCDSDRSKFIRNAIREKLARHGVSTKELAA